jgi:hypothetical protein
MHIVHHDQILNLISNVHDIYVWENYNIWILVGYMKTKSASIMFKLISLWDHAFNTWKIKMKFHLAWQGFVANHLKFEWILSLDIE